MICKELISLQKAIKQHFMIGFIKFMSQHITCCFVHNSQIMEIKWSTEDIKRHTLQLTLLVIQKWPIMLSIPLLILAQVSPKMLARIGYLQYKTFGKYLSVVIIQSDALSLKTQLLSQLRKFFLIMPPSTILKIDLLSMTPMFILIFQIYGLELMTSN